MVNDILTAAFEDEFEKIAASRSFFGNMGKLRLGAMFPKNPKVPSIKLRSTARSGPPTGPPGRSFRSISRELGLPPERAIPMIRAAKQKARATGRRPYDIFEELAKGG